MATMKAVRIHSFGGSEVMRLEDLSIPQPRDDGMLLRVHAAGVNPVDYKARAGKFPPDRLRKAPDHARARCLGHGGELWPACRVRLVFET